MAIGMSGLVSGLDTDTIVKALVSTHTTKRDNLTKEQTKLQWTMESWKALNTKVYNFYSKSLSNLRFSSNYIKKTTSISDSTIAKITAGSGSVNGTQSLAVEQLATSGYLTGGKVKNVKDSSQKITSSSTLADLGVKNSSTLLVGVGGKDTAITFDETTTVSSFVSQLSEAGLNASFDEKNQRFFISSKESGTENDFSITANSANGNAALSALGLQTGSVSKTELDSYKLWASYVNDTDAYDAAVKNAIDNEYNSRKTTVDAQKTAINKTISDLNNQDTAIYQAQYLDKIKQMFADGKTSEEVSEYISQRKKTLSEQIDDDTLSDEKREAFKREMSAINALDANIKNKDGTYNETKVSEQLSKVQKSLGTLDPAGYEDQLDANAKKRTELTEIVNDPDKLEEHTNKLNEETLEKVTNEMTRICEDRRDYAQAFMTQYTCKKGDPEKDGSIDVMTEEEYNKAVADYQAAVAGYDASVAAYGDLFKTTNNNTGDGATRIEGQDAIIYLNGARFESNDNTFAVNGLTITATETTGLNDDGSRKTVSLTTSDDTDAIYDMIRDFFTEYNSIINEMDKLYNAESSKGYEPLTDEEKSELSDEEIEKWEAKIKDSLLKGDSTLNSVAQAMKNAMQQGFTVNGKTTYLTDFGIGTMSYFTAAANEKSALHIDGDEEDSATAGKDDKLKAMIANDPDAVVSFFTQLSNNLYTQLTNKMSATKLSSTYTLYNDKQMQSEYSQYTTKIKEQETKVTWWENYYYRQFTAMEKQLSSLNSQQSALSGLFGS